jgi:hypothetical protein
MGSMVGILHFSSFPALLLIFYCHVLSPAALVLFQYRGEKDNRPWTLWDVSFIRNLFIALL